jgi:hypothetical protein
MKFVPMPTINAPQRLLRNLLHDKRDFEKNTISFSLRNLCPPKAIIHYKRFGRFKNLLFQQVKKVASFV